MTRRRLGGLVLLAAAALLIGVWQVYPAASPPLYDGIILQPPPYRYLTPPKGVTQRFKPTSTSMTVAVANGKSPEEFVETQEQVPQALMVVDSNAFQIPAGVQRITFSIRPVPPPAQPADGAISGNVYLFTATGDNGVALKFNSGSVARIQLRKTVQTAHPVVEQYSNGQWQKRPSSLFVNADYLAANAKSLGYFAMVLPGARSAGASGGSSALPFIVIGAVVVALVILGLLAIRLSRRQVVDERE